MSDEDKQWNTEQVLAELEVCKQKGETLSSDLRRLGVEVAIENKTRHKVQDSITKAVVSLADSSVHVQHTMEKISETNILLQDAVLAYEKRSGEQDKQMAALSNISKNLDIIVNGSAELGTKGLLKESITTKRYIKWMNVAAGVVMVLLFINKENISFSVNKGKKEQSKLTSPAVIPGKTTVEVEKKKNLILGS